MRRPHEGEQGLHDEAPVGDLPANLIGVLPIHAVAIVSPGIHHVGLGGKAILDSLGARNRQTIDAELA